MSKKKFSRDEVINFILESDDDIDLGGHTSDEEDISSDWEFENELVPPPPVTAPVSAPADDDAISETVNDTVNDTVNSVPNEASETAGVLPDESSATFSTSTSEEELISDSEKTDDEATQPAPQVRRGLRTREGGRRGVRTRGGVAHGVVGPNNRSRGGRGRGRGRNRGRGRGRQPQQQRQQPDPEWNWQPINDESIDYPDVPFLDIEGLNIRMNTTTPLSFFELYVTDELVELMVTETNRYASDYIADETIDVSETYTGTWVDTNVVEMKTFIGLLFLMGINHKPTIPLYWSTDELFHTPIFARAMNRNRFQLLLKFLHFNNNNDPDFDVNDENRDRLHKVRPLIDILRRRCRTVYTPGQNVSVDESLVLYKGRLHFKQFIRTKRARFGIKLYELTTADGITLDFLVYCGRGMFDDDDQNDEMPTTERIPVTLMQPFLDSGRILYTDNFYTSPSLAKYLLEHNTHLCGTIRTNRKHFCKELIDVQLEKGHAEFYLSETYNVIACKYRAAQDKASNQQKVVYMLSTCHPPTMVETEKKDREGQNIVKPAAVKSYNQHMGGVDRVDQQLHGVHVLRKHYKWYKKLALRLLSQCMLNAHKIYSKETGSNRSFLDYMHDVILELLTLKPEIPNQRLLTDDNMTRLVGRHFPSLKQAGNNAANKRPTKSCRVCSAKGKRTAKGDYLKTTYVCTFCPSEPGLHPDNCFEQYHTKMDYSQ